jgi:hypothetical protein
MEHCFLNHEAKETSKRRQEEYTIAGVPHRVVLLKGETSQQSAGLMDVGQVVTTNLFEGGSVGYHESSLKQMQMICGRLATVAATAMLGAQTLSSDNSNLSIWIVLSNVSL